MSRRPSIATAVLVVLALTSCRPIVIGPDGQVASSSASRAVDPVSVRVAGKATPGIQIRIRACQQVELQRPEGGTIDVRLRPHALVTDAAGTVIYSSHDFQTEPEVLPSGSYEVPSSPDGSHHIVLPVAGARTPLTIRTFCDSYTVGSHGVYPRWDFPTCTTSTRRCAASAPGAGTWQL